ncbi:MAG: hypothetical protein ACMXYE_01800 [Candidatus Woesearchaeota archaeon]
MVIIYVSKKLEKEIVKQFPRKEADTVFRMIFSLKENPYEGDVLTVVGGVVLKELKHKKFRFYFVQSSKILKVISREDLIDHIIKFIALSDKSKEQQETIHKIKEDLQRFGF